MAHSKKTPKLSKREARIQEELKKRGIQPGSEDAILYANRFLRPGTDENVALAEVALLENRSDTLILDAMRGLDDSVMYTRLVDEQYFTQDDTSLDHFFAPRQFSILQLHARLFVAGMIAERAARRRRIRQAKFAARVKRVRMGIEDPKDDLEELLP